MANNPSTKDLRRQTNFEIVTSNSEAAFEDTQKLLQKYNDSDPRKRVLYMIPHKSDFKELAYDKIFLTKKGQVYDVSMKGRDINNCIDEIITKHTKFGIVAVSSINFSHQSYNRLLNEDLKKKSIDIISHQEGIVMNAMVHEMLKRSVKEIKETGRLSRNFSFRIYRDVKQFL